MVGRIVDGGLAVCARLLVDVEGVEVVEEEVEVDEEEADVATAEAANEEQEA